MGKMEFALKAVRVRCTGVVTQISITEIFPLQKFLGVKRSVFQIY